MTALCWGAAAALLIIVLWWWSARRSGSLMCLSDADCTAVAPSCISGVCRPTPTSFVPPN